MLTLYFRSESYYKNMNRAARKSVLLAAILSGAICPLRARAGGPAHAMLIPLKRQAAETLLKRIDRTQLPEGAVTDPIFQQAFVLRAPKAKDLGIIAIYFYYQPPSSKQSSPEQCGVFLVPPDGPSKYISVIGPETRLGSPVCGGVRSVGVSNDPGTHPRLIFIFNAENMHGKEYPSPWLLTWNSGKDEYELDTTTTTWIWDQKSLDTIPKIRRQLEKRH